MRLHALLILIPICCLCGCGSLIVRLPKEPVPVCYPATCYDAVIIASGGGIYAYGDCNNGLGPFIGWTVVVPLHILDLPISLATDTLMLPFDWPRSSIRREHESREFVIEANVPSTNAPDIMLASKSTGNPVLFTFLPSGESKVAFPGDIILPPDSTNAYLLVRHYGGQAVLRRENRSEFEHPQKEQK